MKVFHGISLVVLAALGTGAWHSYLELRPQKTAFDTLNETGIIAGKFSTPDGSVTATLFIDRTLPDVHRYRFFIQEKSNPPREFSVVSELAQAGLIEGECVCMQLTPNRQTLIIPYAGAYDKFEQRRGYIPYPKAGFIMYDLHHQSEGYYQYAGVWDSEVFTVSPDSKLLAVAENDSGTVSIYNLVTKRPEREHYRTSQPDPSKTESTRIITFTPDSNHVVAAGVRPEGSGRSTWYRHWMTEVDTRTFKAHTRDELMPQGLRSVRCFAVEKDSSQKTTLLLYKMQSKKQVTRISFKK
jgi:WD40 repeat protein